MERMSDREIKLLHDLQAKQKRVQRADSEFFKNVEDRKDEVIRHLDIKDRLNEIATMYGTDSETLYKILTDPEQIEEFKRHYLKSDNDELVIDETRNSIDSDEKKNDPIQIY